MSKPYGIIYKATNKINGKPYIGQTIQGLMVRKSDHKNKAIKCREGKIKSNHFYNAINKYGFDKFIWSIISECDCMDDLNNQEEYYISYYRQNGGVYNISPGGYNKIPSPESVAKIAAANRGKKHTVEAKAKMSEIAKNRSIETRLHMSEAQKGKKHSLEHKEKIGISSMGRKHSDETKAKMKESRAKRLPISDETRFNMSEAQKGKKLSVETKEKIRKASSSRSIESKAKTSASMTGKKHSDETKTKMSISAKGRKHTDESKAKISASKRKNK